MYSGLRWHFSVSFALFAERLFNRRDNLFHRCAGVFDVGAGKEKELA
jgi:hypothetical protein